MNEAYINPTLSKTKNIPLKSPTNETHIGFLRIFKGVRYRQTGPF